MNDTHDTTTRLPSGIVIEALLNKFMDFIGTGYNSYDEVVTIDDVKYLILCSFRNEEHINNMRVFAIHDGKQPELAVTLSMIEWET